MPEQHAQTATSADRQHPAFDAATIKPVKAYRWWCRVNRPGTYRVGLQMDASGFFRCAYCTRVAMISAAWEIKTYQIIARQTGPPPKPSR